jgi:hypothetical protein
MQLTEALDRLLEAGGVLTATTGESNEGAPPVWAEFVRRAGRGVTLGDHRLADDEYTVDAVRDARPWAADLYEEGTGEPFPEDAVVIGRHAQGYAFVFTLPRDGEWAVLSYAEDDPAPTVRSASLEDFLTALIAEFVSDATGEPPFRSVPWRPDLTSDPGPTRAG